METIEGLVDELKSQDLSLPLWFEGGALKLIDQTKLPFEEEVRTADDVEQLANAIRTMMIRGSGAIGISGAWGIYLAAVRAHGNPNAVRQAGQLLKSTRPTAVNLMKTVDETLSAARGEGDELITSVGE